jgi:hypothetical protein
MSPTPGTSARPQPVERFAPTSGLLLGWTGLVAVAVAVVWVAFAVHTVTGLRVGLGAVLFGLVVWVTQLRPRATAYVDRLVLRNSLRDTHIPMRAIDEVAVRHSLQVWTGDERHQCIGIGVSPREHLKSLKRRKQQQLGPSRWQEFSAKAEAAAPDQSAMSYTTFVENRIVELAEAARKEHRGEEGAAVRRSWAWPEVVAFVAVGAAFVVSLLL